MAKVDANREIAQTFTKNGYPPKLIQNKFREQNLLQKSILDKSGIVYQFKCDCSEMYVKVTSQNN